MSTITTPLTEPLKIFEGYIEKADLSVGYGLESSTCQLGLVYESDGPLRSEDFESNFPALGTCVGFKAGECEFAGVFQRYVNKRDLGGYRWDLVLESPAKVLEGVQIILDGFQGTLFTGLNPGDPSAEPVFTNQLNNIWNPFAIKENYQYDGIFGGADVNSMGFPTMVLLELLEEISRGEHDFGGPIVFGITNYELDLTELKSTLAKINNYHLHRIKGPVQTLGGIIQEICDVIMHDFVVTITSKASSISNGIITDPVIKVKMIDKSIPSDTNVVKTMVNKYEREEKIISAEVGKELTNAVTQKLVIGGQARRFVNVSKYGAIQIFGKNKASKPSYTNHVVLEDGSLYLITELLEVRCAMSSKDTWILYHLIKQFKGELRRELSNMEDGLFTQVRINQKIIEDLATGDLNVNDLLDASAATLEKKGKMYQDGIDPQSKLDRLYNSIRSAGEEFYGRKFFVPLPMEPGGVANNLKWVREDQDYVTSWKIASAAWVEGSDVNDISFYDSDGRVYSNAVFQYDPVNADYSQLGENYTQANGGLATKISVEDDLYWLNLGFGYRPYAIVDVNPVNYYDKITTNQNAFYYLLNLELGIEIDKLKKIAGFGADNGPLTYNLVPDRAIPSQFNIAQESTRYTWGPWWDWNSYKGQAEVVVESSLTPENYGGYAILNNVGFAFAYVANSEVDGVESGYVSVTDLPIGNIGERFAVSGPYVSSMSVSLSTGGIRTDYRFNTWTPQAGKLAKYNADRISNIHKSTVRFLQDQRNFFAKPVFRSLRLREGTFAIGQNRPVGLNMGGLNMIGGNLLGNNLNMQGFNVTNGLGPMSQDYANSYGNSNEQWISPAEISRTLPETNDDKPSFIKPITTDHTAKFDGNNPSPTAQELNPYFSQESNDFQLAISGDEPTDINMKNLDDIEKVRVSAFRAPMIMSGWTYDTMGLPTPADPNDSAAFIENVGTERAKWNTGPVDLRWDAERKVFTAPMMVLEGQLASDIPAGDMQNGTEFTLRIKRRNWEDIYGEETVKCINRDPSLVVNIGTETIYASVIRINDEWRPLWVGCTDG